MWLGESDPRGRQVHNEFGEKVRFQIILGSGSLGKAMALLGDRQKDTEGFEQKNDMLQLTFLNDRFSLSGARAAEEESSQEAIGII